MSGFLTDDDDEDVPSIRATIEGLDVNETFARALRFDADDTLKHVPLEALRSLRRSMQATVHRVGEKTGNRYTIEGGQFWTSSRDIMAVLCITRIS